MTHSIQRQIGSHRRLQRAKPGACRAISTGASLSRPLGIWPERAAPHGHPNVMGIGYFCAKMSVCRCRGDPLHERALAFSYKSIPLGIGNTHRGEGTSPKPVLHFIPPKWLHTKPSSSSWSTLARPRWSGCHLQTSDGPFTGAERRRAGKSLGAS
jgi:hypothetical protein